MAKRTKQSSKTQQIANLATLGMPAPVRSVFGTKLGSLLLILLVPALLVTGILTVEWQDGRPRFKFNRARALQVREELPQKFGEEPRFSIPQLAERDSGFRSETSAPLLSLPEQLQLPKPDFLVTPPAADAPRFNIPVLSAGQDESSERPRPFARIRDALDPSR